MRKLDCTLVQRNDYQHTIKLVTIMLKVNSRSIANTNMAVIQD